MRTRLYRLSRRLVLAALCPLCAHAVQIPHASRFDPAIRVVPYNRADKVRLQLAYGQRTHIEFAPGEKVTYVSSGDDDAWDVGPAKNIQNHLFIKPIGKLPTTNLVVVTSKRTYNFDLILVKPRDYYADVLFTYPDADQAKAEAAMAKNWLNAAGAGSVPKVGDNTNYWVQGAAALAPSRAWDDGRFTYLAFAPGAELPALYLEGDDGQEAIAHPSVDPKSGVIAISLLAKKIVLRRGDKLVACVFNKGYAGPGRGASNGTTSDKIERVIKGGAQ
jgi:type IV secretion system protein VirB9